MLISQQIKKLRKKELNLSQEEFAERLGVNPKTVGFWESGKNDPNKSNLLSICNEFGLPSNYFDNVINVISNTDECTDIPVYGDVSASMGYGITVYEEQRTGTYSISNKLAKDIGINLKNSEMIFASGDSMEPTIIGGDSLLIDKSKTEVYDGRIYCVRIDGQLYAKRLQKLPPNKIKVVSDNKEKYDSFYVDFSKDIDFDFAVLGEVKWWGRVAK